MPLETTVLAPGTRVKITQQLASVQRVATTTVSGTVVRFQQSMTGAWFAHSLHDKLWLDRLELRKDDGELVVLNLDQYTVIEAA